MKKKLISILISSLVCFISLSFIVPINYIKASDLPTYIELQPGEVACIGTFVSYGNTKYIWYGNNPNATDSYRLLIGKLNTNQYRVVGVGLTNNYMLVQGSANACPISAPNESAYAKNNGMYNNNSFYYSQPTSYINMTIINDIPFVENSVSTDEYRYRYTYGDLSVGPEPEPIVVDYGALNVGFYTRFGISGTSQTNPTFRENIDVITWDNTTVNGYDMQGKAVSVKIRAVPIIWTAITENALDILGFADASPDLQYAVEFYPINFNDNQYQLRWGDLINRFQSAMGTFNYMKYSSNSAWYKNGWYYQIKYYYSPIDSDYADYESEWQTITTGTSVNVSDSEKIEYNYQYQIQYGVDPSLYNAIQNVNNDNSTTNNWYIEELTINMGDESVNGNKPWYEVLLESITSILNKIIEVIGGLFSDVIDGVLELVHNLGIDFLQVFSDLISNVVDLFGSIDLSDNDYLLPDTYSDNVNTFHSWTTGIINVFFTSGLGLYVLVPMVMLVVRLFL